MVAVKFNQKGIVIAVSFFETVEQMEAQGFIIYNGDIKPEKLLRKTKEELRI
jgi:hypothetical protein